MDGVGLARRAAREQSRNDCLVFAVARGAGVSHRKGHTGVTCRRMEDSTGACHMRASFVRNFINYPSITLHFAKTLITGSICRVVFLRRCRAGCARHCGRNARGTIWCWAQRDGVL